MKSSLSLFLATLITIIYLGGFLAEGYARVDMTRAIAWMGCALAGAIGFWMLLADRDTPVSGLLFRVALLFLLCLLCGGVLYLLPLPLQVLRTISPVVWESYASFEAAGLIEPKYVALAAAPEKAYHSINQVIAALGFFLGAAALCRIRSGRRFAMFLVCALAVLEGWLGLFSVTLGDASRASGILYNPNHHAAVVMVGLVPAFGWWMRERGSMKSRDGADFSLAILVLLAGAALGGLLAFSRGVLTMLAIGVMLAGLLRVGLPARERGTKHAIERYLLMAAGTLLLFSVLAGGIPQVYSARMGSLDSANGRFKYWHASLKYIHENRHAGFGPGGTEYLLNIAIADTPLLHNIVHAHSDILQITLELGTYICFLLFLAACWILSGYSRGGPLRLKKWFNGLSSARRLLAISVLLSMVLALVEFHLRIPLVSFQIILSVSLLASTSVGGNAHTQNRTSCQSVRFPS